ncbi:DUF6110 family protein [Chakrabartyella piscis]|uniref:DUF6110 family protein n=1 Tax=Chakrabartyella piscis TaxID=2918914 RepID=UPI0029586B71|nr:DUF6110 family protein [Chakrabartyella piscis]
MLDCFKKDCVWCFLGGAVAGILGAKVAKSKKTRTAVVKTVAKGLMAKDTVEATVADLREDVEDLYESAKDEAKKAKACDCECDCEEIEEVEEA